MKVNLIKVKTVLEFGKAHANARVHCNNFINVVKAADWNVPMDIKATLPADLIGSDRVVVDLGGNGKNAFRFICRYKFKAKKVNLYVAWMGTHEEYNALSPKDKLTVWKF